MRHWTQTGAHVAALVLLALSCLNLFLGAGWQAVGGMALAVVLLAALAFVEHFSDVRANLSVKAEVESLKAKVEALTAAQAKTDETAKAALSGVLEARNHRPMTKGY